MTKAPPTYYDWSMPLDDFRRGLVRLRDHIADHQMYEGFEEDVENMDLAIGLLDVMADDDYAWDDATDVAWDNLWPLIHCEMRKWWC